jgi:hypothetical protein
VWAEKSGESNFDTPHDTPKADPHVHTVNGTPPVLTEKD